MDLKEKIKALNLNKDYKMEYLFPVLYGAPKVGQRWKHPNSRVYIRVPDEIGRRQLNQIAWFYSVHETDRNCYACTGYPANIIILGELNATT